MADSGHAGRNPRPIACCSLPLGGQPPACRRPGPAYAPAEFVVGGCLRRAAGSFFTASVAGGTLCEQVAFDGFSGRGDHLGCGCRKFLREWPPAVGGGGLLVRGRPAFGRRRPVRRHHSWIPSAGCGGGWHLHSISVLGMVRSRVARTYVVALAAKRGVGCPEEPPELSGGSVGALYRDDANGKRRSRLFTTRSYTCGRIPPSRQWPPA